MAVEWARLTRHAKRAVVESQELAAALGGDSVKPDHLLMTLLDDSASMAALLICLSGGRPDEVRCALEDRLADALGASVEKPPYSPAVRELLEQAARLTDAGPVGTGQLLVAALESGDEAAVTLQNAGVDPAEVRIQLEAMGIHELYGFAARPAPDAGPRAIPTPGVAEDRVAENTKPDSRYAERPPSAIESAKGPTAPSGSNSAGGAHTLQALARLVVDLAAKASKAAREHGSPALGEQLDQMRREVERQMRASAPGSQLAANVSNQKSA
ncbi:MAG TPA: Clp protease N-terminal domain-containing protein [Armatimonadota bacterium]|nr:Clp protease N-terminal domain-containing protein [Armatimonadota bacterium]